MAVSSSFLGTGSEVVCLGQELVQLPGACRSCSPCQPLCMCTAGSLAVAACLPGAAYTQANSAPAVPSGDRCLEPSLLASRKRSVTSDSLMGKGQFSSRDWLLLFLPGDPCHLVLGLVSRRSRASAPVPAMTLDVPAVALGSSGDRRWGGGSCFTVLSATPCP